MRKTDNPSEAKRYFRASDRVFKMNGSWFFSSREGDIGPFLEQQLAEVELERFVSEQVALLELVCGPDLLAVRKCNYNWRNVCIFT